MSAIRTEDALFEAVACGDVVEEDCVELLDEMRTIQVECTQCGKRVTAERQPWDPKAATLMQLGYCDDCPSNACDGGPVYYYDKFGEEVSAL